MRYFIEFSYLGTFFNGWQRQPNAPTVQEEMERAFSKILRTEITINGSSRTDTGVHARQQFAHFDTTQKIKNLEQLTYKINQFLGKTIAIQAIYAVSDNKHSRFDATHRTYRYSFHRTKNPFSFQTSVFFAQKLNEGKIQEASNLLLQYTNFQCFSKVKTEVNTFDCTISIAEWQFDEDEFYFTIKANRFLRGMVRAIVGTLLDVGAEKISVADFEQIILSKNRNNAGRNVEPHGLTLMEVGYPKNYFESQLSIEPYSTETLPIVRDLFREYAENLGVDLCFQGFEKELADLPAAYSTPKGTILLAKDNSDYVGVVALKPLDNTTSEMKRLYVRASHKGLGIGRILAEKITEKAQEIGYKTLKLDTLKRLNAAVELYKSMGFEETEAYNFNPENDIIYMQKTL
jgi:tRNA pseudouridine38-40 synthase